AEVLVARVNGHVDNPVILGGLYKRDQQNPVSEHNAYQNVISTRAGNRLVLNDAPHARQIVLATPDDENHIVLNACGSAPSVQLDSKKGYMKLSAAASSLFEAQKSMQVNADGPM